MTSAQKIEMLLKRNPGRFSSELGIDILSGHSGEIFKWLLASVLFGARISGTVVEHTFREFVRRNVVTPRSILDTGWDGLVAILDQGGYVRYDFKTATKLLDLCRTLTETYRADLIRLHAEAQDSSDLEERLKALAKGVGDVTVNIFLRELRGLWEKADPLPSELVVQAAHDFGIVPKAMRDRRNVLNRLKDAWRNAEKKERDFPDFEAALVRAGIGMRRKQRRGASTG